MLLRALLAFCCNRVYKLITNSLQTYNLVHEGRFCWHFYSRTMSQVVPVSFCCSHLSSAGHEEHNSTFEAHLGDQMVSATHVEAQRHSQGTLCSQFSLPLVRPWGAKTSPFPPSPWHGNWKVVCSSAATATASEIGLSLHRNSGLCRLSRESDIYPLLLIFLTSCSHRAHVDCSCALDPKHHMQSYSFGCPRARGQPLHKT